MRANVYEGYFDNGKFYNNERQIINIPEQQKVYVTLFDERVDKKAEAASLEKQRPFSLSGKRGVPETMLLSELALAKDWDTPEEDEAWADL